jgi:hypothetical protein
MAFVYNGLNYTDNGNGTCSVASNVGVAGAITIPTTAINGINSLTVTTISSAAFIAAVVLTSISIPDSVTTIGASAFQFCTALTSVAISPTSTLTAISNQTFLACSALPSIVIPGSVTFIGTNAFNSCTSLLSVQFNDPNHLTSISFALFSATNATATYFNVPGAVVGGLNATASNLPPYFTTNNYFSQASCFNHDTKILCLNKALEEEYIPVQHLRKGDAVKTYLHGYRKIDCIGKGLLLNDATKLYNCMHKMKKTTDNGLTDDLIVTGGHSILVDALTEKEKALQQEKNFNVTIDGKHLLLACISDKFEMMENSQEYTYYHFTVENESEDDQRFGIWANGILSETTQKTDFIKHGYKEMGEAI